MAVLPEPYDHGEYGPGRQTVVYLIPHQGEEGDGIRLTWNDNGFGYRLAEGAEGLGVAASENTLAPLARGGAIIQHQRLSEGDLFLPIIIKAPSGREGRSMLQALVEVIRPADGTLDVVVEDPRTGDTRSRRVAYRDGLDSWEWRSPQAQKYGVSFDFVEPLWRGTRQSVVHQTKPALKPFLSVPSVTVSDLWSAPVGDYVQSSWDRVDGGIEKRGTGTQTGINFVSRAVSAGWGQPFNVEADVEFLTGDGGGQVVIFGASYHDGVKVGRSAPVIETNLNGRWGGTFYPNPGASSVTLGFFTQPSMDDTQKVRISNVSLRSGNMFPDPGFTGSWPAFNKSNPGEINRHGHADQKGGYCVPVPARPGQVFHFEWRQRRENYVSGSFVETYARTRDEAGKIVDTTRIMNSGFEGWCEAEYVCPDGADTVEFGWFTKKGADPKTLWRISNPTLTAAPSHSDVPSRRNLLENPSFESGLSQPGRTTFSGGSASTTLDEDWCLSGSQSIKIAPDGKNGSAFYPFTGGLTSATTGSVFAHYGLKAGGTYTVAGTIRLAEAQSGSLNGLARKLAVTFVKDGASIGTESSVAAPNEPGEYRLKLTFKIPSNAQGLSMRLLNGSQSTPVWWDGLTMEEGATDGTYFDGDTTNDGEHVYRWVGEPHKSESVRIDRADSVDPVAPFFPIILGESTINSRIPITITGDTEVWPTWTITGPGEDVSIESNRGERIFIPGPINSPITIITEPQRQTIRDESGPIWDRIPVGQDQLFPLRPGANSIKMSMVSATGASHVDLDWSENWKAGL